MGKNPVSLFQQLLADKMSDDRLAMIISENKMDKKGARFLRSFRDKYSKLPIQDKISALSMFEDIIYNVFNEFQIPDDLIKEYADKHPNQIKVLFGDSHETEHTDDYDGYNVTSSATKVLAEPSKDGQIHHRQFEWNCTINGLKTTAFDMITRRDLCIEIADGIIAFSHEFAAVIKNVLREVNDAKTIDGSRHSPDVVEEVKVFDRIEDVCVAFGKVRGSDTDIVISVVSTINSMCQKFKIRYNENLDLYYINKEDTKIIKDSIPCLGEVYTFEGLETSTVFLGQKVDVNKQSIYHKLS